MEAITLNLVLETLANFGIPGLIVVLWFLSDRSHRHTLSSYHDDMQEIRRMYENNASLVKHYEDVAKDLHNVVIMNAQVMQGLVDDIRTNQYCPQIRLEKAAKGVQG